MLTLIISSREHLAVFLRTFVILIIIFAILISFLGFLDLFGVVPYESYFLIERTTDSPFPYDNNFGLVPVLFSMVALLQYILFKKQKVSGILLCGILVGVFSAFVILSGSKRGIVLFSLIIAFVILTFIISLFRKKIISNSARLGLGISILIFFVFTFGVYIFYTQISFTSKNEFLRRIGTKDLTDTKARLSSNTYKFYSLFKPNSSLREYDQKLWSKKFDSKDPGVGWAGTYDYETIFPLTGVNVEIVPEGSKGLLIDSSNKCDTWDGDSYSITSLGRVDTDSAQIAEISVFCYVSEDFNGNWAKLILLYTRIGEIHSTYDLQNKGTWQKLTISDKCLTTTAESRFCFYKQGVTDFSSLRGYVIIAYPQFSLHGENGESGSLYITKTDKTGIFTNKHILAGFFDISGLSEHIIFKPKIDPIRNWVKRFVVEDTTYFGYKSRIEIKPSSGLFKNDDRFTHWQFSAKLFLKEYNWKQKIIGNGFDHLNWFGYYFLKDRTLSDWPHNPFLSVLLYSGIIGLSIYFFFLYKVFYYYLKYIKEYPLIFIFFIICFFFSFFSGGSPFDPPVMGFFVLLPFLIHYIHKVNRIVSE
jgi:hypothetical protein